LEDPPLKVKEVVLWVEVQRVVNHWTQGGTEKVTRKKSKSSAEHKAEWRKEKGNVVKELAQKRERHKKKRPEKQKT